MATDTDGPGAGAPIDISTRFWQVWVAAARVTTKGPVVGGASVTGDRHPAADGRGRRLGRNEVGTGIEEPLGNASVTRVIHRDILSNGLSATTHVGTRR
jgi:hypothetical protein